MALTLRDMLKQAAKASIGEKGAESKRKLDSLTTLAEQNSDTHPLGAMAPYDSGAHSQKVTPKGDTNQPHPLVSPGLTAVTPGDTTPHQMVTPSSSDLLHHLVTPSVTKITRLERVVLRFVEERKEITIPLKSVAKILDISPTTLYKIIPRLRNHGLIWAEKVGNDGTYLKFISWTKVTPTGDTMSSKMVSPVGSSMSYKMVTPNGETIPPLKIDREKNLSISQERVNVTWPTLAATGFGSYQIEQILQALTELGKPTDKIVQSLDHAEWELENGKMLDKAGSPVVDPCSWVFRSLVKTGYYRKPKGYISPEEQALNDSEETAKALLIARQRAEQAQFDAWKAGLTPEYLEAAMVGFVGGPKDQWLKAYWMKHYRMSKH